MLITYEEYCSGSGADANSECGVRNEEYCFVAYGNNSYRTMSEFACRGSRLLRSVWKQFIPHDVGIWLAVRTAGKNKNSFFVLIYKENCFVVGKNNYREMMPAFGWRFAPPALDKNFKIFFKKLLTRCCSVCIMIIVIVTI